MATIETLQERIRETERTIQNAKEGKLKNPIDIEDYKTYLSYLKQKKSSKIQQEIRNSKKR